MTVVILLLGLLLSLPSSLSQTDETDETDDTDNATEIVERVDFPEDEEINPTHKHTGQRYYFTKGTGDTPENAPEIFIPIKSHSNDGHNTKGDEFLSSLMGNSSEARTLVAIDLNIRNPDGNVRELFISAQEESGDRYEIAHNVPASEATKRRITFDLKALCGRDTQLKWDCSLFRGGESDAEEILLFISIGAKRDVNLGTSINPKSYGGVYLKLKLSSIVQTSAPILERLYKGENRIRVSYTGEGVQEPLSNYAIRKQHANVSDNTSCSNIKTEEATYGELVIDPEEDIFELNSSGNSSQDFVRGLKNNYCYTIQVFYQDKYYFASRVSSGLSAIPEDIEELLKKQACFLFTAGFRGDDPIVRFLRHYRDSTLAHHPIGRWLIQIYYRYAPLYTPFILRHPPAGKIVRGLGHGLYFFLKYKDVLLWILSACFLFYYLHKHHRRSNGRA